MACLVNDEFVPMIPSDAILIQQAILPELHGSALRGHFIRKKMDVLVKNQFYWPSIKKNVWQFCAKCDVCRHSKVAT